MRNTGSVGCLSMSDPVLFVRHGPSVSIFIFLDILLESTVSREVKQEKEADTKRRRHDGYGDVLELPGGQLAMLAAFYPGNSESGCSSGYWRATNSTSRKFQHAHLI